jgi:hypothetical protein
MGKFSEAFKHSDHKEPLEPPPTFHEATFQPLPQIQAGSSSNQAPSFACLLLSSSDKIRTVNFPENTLSHIEEAIKRVWAPGIQAQKYQAPGNYEWKLTGRPCMSPIGFQLMVGYGSGAEAIPCRRLIIHILHALAAIGWHIHISADLTKKQWDKDSLFFKSGPPLQRYFFSITFNESDKVRIIDSPSETVTEAFKTVVAVRPCSLD